MGAKVFLTKEFETGGYLGGPYPSATEANTEAARVLAGGYQVVSVDIDGIDWSSPAADVLDEVWDRVAKALPAIADDADLLQDISTEILSERLV
jgi:t-SNARE complex subunit (syntaxin)